MWRTSNKFLSCNLCTRLSNNVVNQGAKNCVAVSPCHSRTRCTRIKIRNYCKNHSRIQNFAVPRSSIKHFPLVDSTSGQDQNFSCTPWSLGAVLSIIGTNCTLLQLQFWQRSTLPTRFQMFPFLSKTANAFFDLDVQHCLQVKFQNNTRT